MGSQEDRTCRVGETRKKTKKRTKKPALPRDEEAPINVVRLDGEDEESEPKKSSVGIKKAKQMLRRGGAAEICVEAIEKLWANKVSMEKEKEKVKEDSIRSSSSDEDSSNSLLAWDLLARDLLARVLLLGMVAGVGMEKMTWINQLKSEGQDGVRRSEPNLVGRWAPVASVVALLSSRRRRSWRGRQRRSWRGPRDGKGSTGPRDGN